jgi:hypothetical protein
LNTATVGFLLRSHVDHSLRVATPLSTRRGQECHSSSPFTVKSTKAISSSVSS